MLLLATLILTCDTKMISYGIIDSGMRISTESGLTCLFMTIIIYVDRDRDEDSLMHLGMISLGIMYFIDAIGAFEKGFRQLLFYIITVIWTQVTNMVFMTIWACVIEAGAKVETDMYSLTPDDILEYEG